MLMQFLSRMMVWLGGLGMLVALTACAPAHMMPGPAPLLIWHPAPPAPRPAVPDVPPSYMVLLPNADGSVGQVTMQSNQGKQTLKKPKEAADLAGGADSFSVTDAQLKRDFGAAMGARPALPERFRIYFASGTSRLTNESMATLAHIIRRSQQFSALEVLIIGHTDTMGSPEVNYQLGLVRARQLADMMIAQGIRAVNIELGSEGESQPLVHTPDNTPEPRNRRVEVTLR